MNHRQSTHATATSLIARAVLELKKRENITFEQMGELIGVRRVTLMEYTYGDRIPKTRAVKKLARFFQWTPEEVGVAVMFKPEKKRKKRKAKA